MCTVVSCVCLNEDVVVIQPGLSRSKNDIEKSRPKRMCVLRCWCLCVGMMLVFNHGDVVVALLFELDLK